MRQIPSNRTSKHHCKFASHVCCCQALAPRLFQEKVNFCQMIRLLPFHFFGRKNCTVPSGEKFSPVFPVKRKAPWCFALIRESRRRIWNGKSHFYWLAQFPFCSGVAFHYAKDSGNFGRNSNGKDRFGFFWPEYSGSHLEVVHIFRSEYSDQNLTFHFWQPASFH